jgi:protein SHQ1
VVLNNVVCFICRLQLPGNIIEDEQSTASYDIATGIFTIKVTKETAGEHFEDLDLLTKLLARRGEVKQAAATPQKPLIEVISSTTETPEDKIMDGMVSNTFFTLPYVLVNN